MIDKCNLPSPCGAGAFTHTDKDHARIRKIMNPAFTAAQLKSFLPLFLGSAQKVRVWAYAIRGRGLMRVIPAPSLA